MTSTSSDPMGRWEQDGGALRAPRPAARPVRPAANSEREQDEACYREAGVDQVRRAVDLLLDTPARGIPGRAHIVPADLPLADVATILLDGSVGALAVVDEDGVLTGVITPTAILRVVLDRLTGPLPLTAADCAAPARSRLESADAVRHALAQTEVGGNAWHIPVVDGDDRPVALLSPADVLRFIVSELWPAGMGCTLTAPPEAAAREGG
ncbi:MAG: CBS domain-containing protein [Planctomycetota bacterium]|jgi:CBS domain-containing protein